MLFYIDHFIQLGLLPPGNVLLLGLLGIILWRVSPRVGKFFLGTAFLGLWLFSTPVIAQAILESLQSRYAPISVNELKSDISGHSAIVVLEAGLNYATPEYGKITVSQTTLARIRYAAFLYQKTHIPILVSGSDPSQPNINQADYMADSLKDYFGVPTRWKEASGFNTAQEAILSAEILKKAGVDKVYLVTSAFHMPRAVNAFSHRGLIIIPAPTGFIHFENNLGTLSNFLPSIDALAASNFALREYIGMVWYKIHYLF